MTTSTVLFTLGTPFGSWSPFAVELLSHASDGANLQLPEFSVWHKQWLGDRLPHESPPPSPAQRELLAAMVPTNAGHWGGVDVNACWTLDALSTQFPQARFLIFVESAAQALGAWLIRDDRRADVAQALQCWHAAADRILRHVQRHLPRCLLVDAIEAQANPKQLATLCSERFGIPFGTPGPVPNTTDALAVALGATVAMSDAGIEALQAELHASCVPLSEDDLKVETDSYSDVDAVAALNSWHRLRSAHSELEEAKRQIDEQNRALAALRTERDLCCRDGEALRERSELGDRLAASLREELDRARGETESGKQDTSLLRLQFHHVQEELATSCDANANLHRDMQTLRTSLDEAHRQIVEANRALTTLRTEHDGCRHAGEALREQAELSERVGTSLRQELERAGHEVTSSRQDNELLLLQFHHVQEELEQYQAALREQQSRDSLRTSLGLQARGAVFEVERVELGTERDTPPHRELSIVLDRVKTVDRNLHRVELRLVEHHGRPGLVFFALAGVSTPVLAWQTTGQEDGRDYMLLVPGDLPARERLQVLGASDWRFVLNIATALARFLDTEGSSRRWSVVAERLRSELTALPVRLRYDRVEAADDSDVPDAVRASLAPVSFGANEASRLSLRWWPSSAMIELLAPAVAHEAPLLSGWPMDDSGAWASSWRLPLMHVPDAERKQAWRALAPCDRELLLAILDALPAVAGAASATSLGLANGSEALVSAAARPLRLALRSLRGGRVRRAWHALRGRAAA